MDNLGEKVTGITGGDKRVCVPCAVTYNLCALRPPPTRFSSVGAVPTRLALAVFCQ